MASVSWLGEPVHRTILALDIEGYTRPDRRDSDRLRMRSALYHLLEQALARAGIAPGEYVCSDQGDGVLVLLGAEVPKTRVLPWLILRLAAGLDRHNRAVAPRLEVRLRVVLHAGEVASDTHGHASKDLNLAFRLLDSVALRDRLADGDTSLVLLVSHSIFDDVVRQGYQGIDPEAFLPLDIVEKNTRARAWLYVPGRGTGSEVRTRPAVDDLSTPSGLLVPHELPADIPNFTGRELELGQLLTNLARQDAISPSIMAIYGVGGVGKSALAVHAGHRLASAFPDGQIYVNLQGSEMGLRPLSPADLVARALRAFGMNGRHIPVDPDEAAARLRSLMAGRRVLLVLDNAVSAAQVRPLLPASPGCAAIITSRALLATLDGASHLHLRVLSSIEALGLLGKLCGRDRLAAAPGAAEDLARQCDYLPLALRIAGARLAARPNWPVRVLAHRLADERTRLDELESDDLAVRSCFQIGYRTLNGSPDPRERLSARLFRLLGLHRGPDVGTWTAAALLNTNATSAEEALEQLVDAQLLETSARRRYRMHGLLTLFAREQADRQETEEDRQAALRRMLACYLATAHRGQRLLQPTAVGGRGWSIEAAPAPLTSRADAFSWFEEERLNLLAAAQHAAEGPAHLWDFIARLAEVMFWFLQVRSYWRDFEEINLLALRVARRRGDRHGQALALNDLGYAYAGLRSLDRAVECLERSRQIFAELDDPLWEHIALGALGAVRREQGHPDQAIEFLQRALSYFQQIDHPNGVSAALNNLALAYSDRGQFADAMDCLEKNLAICGQTHDLFCEVLAISNLGEVHYRAGRADTALEWYERSLSIHREIGDRYREAETLWRLGWARDALGHQARAHESWEAAQRLFEELGITAPEQQELQRTAWW